ncbi:NAD(P)-dependent alcohol dehydrogenase [Bradyrhizobium sp. AUGA SZCCT0042]|uniref:NAD(P)-dependent alcohol dehydrogenase n=1 Tax=Bradyrhizobium sp. AUGA SZCCT0042 TaxID=2807651 RepID=UPI001BA7C35C|nr:NAD(P)-dependent alcohol dehydrogenase [Bradyrhizobium sp. AUGA SZCCT0042]MBR1301133.1 NAD(P)-dependent alcohol dehydrogenase [Bradyrhizobium sp. AUGA SZCCT0042]
MKVFAAIARSSDEPFSIEECALVRPSSHEVRVKVHACGICHTDSAAKLQHLPVPFPQTLGHEGAGVVEEVGSGVTSLVPGDHVVMTFGSCGTCESCASAKPAYCDDFLAINIAGRREGGAPLRQHGKPVGQHFFAQSAFSTHAIATPRNLVKVDASLPLELLAPLGCGIQTGMGTVLNVLRPAARTGIAVFGVGAVGMASVIAAKIVGCNPIIAVDLVYERLEAARSFGATHVIDGRSSDVSLQIRAITGKGAHFSVDTTGHPSVITEATTCLRKLGVVAQLAAPARGTQYCVPSHVLGGGGLSWRGVVEGDSDIQTFIPDLVRYYRAGQLPLDRIVTTYPLSSINQAIADSDSGKVLKAVLVMP